MPTQDSIPIPCPSPSYDYGYDFAGCSNGCAQSQALMTAAIDGVMIYWLSVSGPIPHPSDPGNERKPLSQKVI
jgi:hypothetical protein